MIFQALDQEMRLVKSVSQTRITVFACTFSKGSGMSTSIPYRLILGIRFGTPRYNERAMIVAMSAPDDQTTTRKHYRLTNQFFIEESEELRDNEQRNFWVFLISMITMAS